MTDATLLVYGDASVDISMRITNLPSAGMDTAASDPLITAGGSAANCAATVARLGPEVELAAVVGDDLFSEMIINNLVSHGVGISAIETTSGPSAVVMALIDPRGQRTFVSARGPAADPLLSDSYLDILDRAAMVHISGYSFQARGSRSTALHLLREAHRRGIPTSLDPSPLFATHYDPLSKWLGQIDFLFPNAAEATAITGAPSPQDAATALRRLGVGTVVVTMGADGCLLQNDDGTALFPAFPNLPVVDTTGAGDGFAGGFLAVILGGGSPRQACRVGNLVAARVIAERGGHRGAPSVHDLRRLADRWGDAPLQKAVETLISPSRAVSAGTGAGR